MKGLSLHRAGLTKENMGVLEELTHSDVKKTNTRAQLNQYYKTVKSQELDILWGGVQKGIQKVHNATKTTVNKSPATYLIIGFIAGVIFMSLITFIVSISTMATKTPTSVTPNETTNSNVTLINDDNQTAQEQVVVAGQEKYVVKAGDTINGIANRFYGKYDEAKIQEILRINNIEKPESIQIGQELIIPVTEER